ncbi:hypothetical protein [Streptomyces sp. NPDC058373]|uniref:hypothetical protein n=1 Tax=Streptomyces sp. NPDC058373 TaxID=3346465 RepID=UPI00365AD7A3
MRTRPLATALVLALAAGGGVLVLAPAATAAPEPGVPALPYDVNGDGYAESVVGVPGGGKGGCLTVVPGSAKGPVTAKHQVISQASPGVGGTDEKGDAFGTAPVPAQLQPGLPRPAGQGHRFRPPPRPLRRCRARGRGAAPGAPPHGRTSDQAAPRTRQVRVRTGPSVRPSAR